MPPPPELPELAQIEATLSHKFTTTRKLGSYSAFYAPLPTAVNSHAVTDQIEQHCRQWQAMGYTVFVGLLDRDPNHGIWAIQHPNPDPVELMTIFQVGSHNAAPGSHIPADARQFMGALYKTDPYVPYFIDAAGFKVKFLEPVTAARAAEIEHTVVTFDPDAYDLANQQAILAKQKLELWWD